MDYNCKKLRSPSLSFVQGYPFKRKLIILICKDHFYSLKSKRLFSKPFSDSTVQKQETVENPNVKL